MIRYELADLPDDLPPGDHATTIKEARWEDGELVVYLIYTGPIDPAQPRSSYGLFVIHKEATP
jgi:hypothetical protein